jgi:hypothetical protein
MGEHAANARGAVRETMATSNPKFRALYYPYSRLLYETDLKRAVLTFDEILFVDPLSADFFPGPGQGILDGHAQALLRCELDASGHALQQEEFEAQHDTIQRALVVAGGGEKDTLLRWYAISGTYKFLKKHKIITLASSQRLLKPFDEVISFAILRDIIRCRLRRLPGEDIETPQDVFDVLSRRTVLSWKVHESRLPTKLGDIICTPKSLKHCVKLMAPGAQEGDIDAAAVGADRLRFRAVLGDALLSRTVGRAQPGSLALGSIGCFARHGRSLRSPSLAC